jgi:hypothetical protein
MAENVVRSMALGRDHAQQRIMWRRPRDGSMHGELDMNRRLLAGGSCRGGITKIRKTVVAIEIAISNKRRTANPPSVSASSSGYPSSIHATVMTIGVSVFVGARRCPVITHHGAGGKHFEHPTVAPSRGWI